MHARKLQDAEAFVMGSAGLIMQEDACGLNWLLACRLFALVHAPEELYDCLAIAL